MKNNSVFSYIPLYEKLPHQPTPPVPTPAKASNFVFLLKWLATATVIISTVLTSFKIAPLNVILGVIGSILWIFVGISWKENSVTYLNFVLLICYAAGIAYAGWPSWH